jgi:HlyD family secretion protein
MRDGPRVAEGGLPLAETGIGPGRNDLASAAEAPARPGLFLRLRLWRVPLAMAFLFTGAVVGMSFQPPALRAFFGLTGLEPGGGSSYPIAVPAPRTNPVPEALPSVTALGRLMPQGDVVTLAPPFGAADARIARLLVAEGDRVSEGQVIAELDSLPQLAAALASAEAGLAAREAALAQTRAAVASARAEAEANRDRAASAAVLAAAEAARIRDLFDRGVAAKAALDQAEAAAVQAQKTLDSAEAQLARQEGGEAQADVEVALRQVDLARADLARAQGDMARGQVVAPQAGMVISLHVRVGEKPGSAGIATLGATDHMQAELEVYQTDIARVAPGQAVTLSSPALAQDLTGEVARIALEVERQTLLASDPAANTDARIIRVTVALDAESSALAARLTGLQVTGRIQLAPAPPAPGP